MEYYLTDQQFEILLKEIELIKNKEIYSVSKYIMSVFKDNFSM